MDKQGSPTAPKLVLLNLLKNRNSGPLGSDLDGSVTISKMLESQDNANVLEQHLAASTTGVLFDLGQEKGVSCYCYSTDSNDWDFHI